MAQSMKPIPDGYHAITPYLCVGEAAKAIEFYEKAFGARELCRMPMPDGRIGHAELEIGDSKIMLADEFPEMEFKSPKSLGGTPVTLHFYVEKVDDVFQRAVAAGAKVRRPLKNEFYGDRSGYLEDPFGHVWILSTHIEDLTPEEIQHRSSEAMGAGQ